MVVVAVVADLLEVDLDVDSDSEPECSRCRRQHRSECCERRSGSDQLDRWKTFPLSTTTKVKFKSKSYA